ncbi:hypothetical protein P153DRAFT_361808 [Dothidotthia symphoricarpi CBS 119687]|uniref:Uncharacterized protein n=1 Tax=Dothidotthia symphoricarpi CBS 119687 TaxID=1392245 RepID=A0A6A5ZVD9_9PLEO|nr:uncharacterized protein P153DRAFT_361808 [Dothidotthia symphoricarpi CBS 119687]KAF2123682.1 hypothetical protein P153DRAFT_361808 [Dothidotthia symphoricarpi CBS 119687]
MKKGLILQILPGRGGLATEVPGSGEKPSPMWTSSSMWMAVSQSSKRVLPSAASQALVVETICEDTELTKGISVVGGVVMQLKAERCVPKLTQFSGSRGWYQYAHQNLNCYNFVANDRHTGWQQTK